MTFLPPVINFDSPVHQLEG